MPKVMLEAPHALEQEEAARRLKDKFHAVREAYGDKVSDLKGDWEGNTLSFGFRVMGMKISGTAEVAPSVIKLVAKLPLAAMMFRGQVESRVKEEMATLLA